MVACKEERTWILDSGSCFDIVNVGEMKPDEKRNMTDMNKPYRLSTANDIVKANMETVIPIAKTGLKATAIVMEDTPCVLSLGERCMEEGYSFHWGRWRKPNVDQPIWQAPRVGIAESGTRNAGLSQESRE